MIVLSDHGNGAITGYLNLNVWLLQEGYIALRPGVRTAIRRWLFKRGKTPSWGYRRLARMGFADLAVGRLRGGQLGWVDSLVETIFLSRRDIDWSRTRAYAQGNYGQINLNLKGREPRGVVEGGAEARALEEEIRGKLLALRLGGIADPVVGAVRRADEVYHGPLRPNAPDLLVEMRDPHHHTIGLFDFTSHKLFMKAFSMSGDHRNEGVLFAAGPAVRRSSAPRAASIQDMAPTILRLLGLPVPADMDGRVIEEILEEAAGAPAACAMPVETGAPAPPPQPSESSAYSPQEEAEVLQRLEDLGYL